MAVLHIMGTGISIAYIGQEKLQKYTGTRVIINIVMSAWSSLVLYWVILDSVTRTYKGY